MTEIENLEQILQSIYDAGNIDWVSFGDLIALVSYGKADQLLDKAPTKRLQDAILLAKFLIARGDFEFGNPQIGIDGRGDFQVAAGGYAELKSNAEEYFKRGGILDVDLISGLWFRKIRVDAAPLVDDNVFRELSDIVGTD